MYYYIKTHFGGWQRVNREYYREFCEYLRRGIQTALNRDEIIAARTRTSEYPLDIADLAGGVQS